MATFFERYQGGEHERVWDELVRRGEEVFEEPLFSDARAVARETMRRVRHNIELLVPRLHQLSYQFATLSRHPDYWKDVPVFVPSPPDTNEAIEEVEDLVGTIPLSLRAWYEIVGHVSLIGFHPEWPRTDELDPLWVEHLTALLGNSTKLPEIRASFEFLMSFSRNIEKRGGEPFVVEISPDLFHKNNFSGGAEYGIPVPTKAADALLLHEWHETTFVNYLRICFRWGGFPGIERCKDDVYKQNFLRYLPFLTQGFLPI